MTDQFLTEQEMHHLDSANYENQIRLMEIKILAEKRDKLKLQAELLSSKVLLLENDMLAKQNVHKNKVGNHKKWLAELRERYGIPEDAPFGHDPQTGQLHFTRSK